MILKMLYGVTLPGFRYDRLTELRRKIELYSGIPLQPHEPIVGEGVFKHESGIHTAAIAIHPAIYQFIAEESVGGEQRFVFGKHSGAAAVESVLAKHTKALRERGVEISPDLVKQVLDCVKALREQMLPFSGSICSRRAFTQSRTCLTRSGLISTPRSRKALVCLARTASTAAAPLCLPHAKRYSPPTESSAMNW